MQKNIEIGRRGFLLRSAGIAAGALAGSALAGLPTARGEETGLKTSLKKALIANRPSRDYLEKLKAAGFDGVEAYPAAPADAEGCRKNAEDLGLRIHSVLRGWAEFNSQDAGKRDQSIAATEEALRAAQAYGADAILLVPCRIGGMRMPRPWEFHIDFDEATGHIRTVTRGDNTPFQDYIQAHDHAVDTSRKAVRKLIPLAEQTGVVIALENVWNNLWVEPAIFASFVASFRSPWVKAYFDIGNHVKYARPEEWILALGDLTAKCHVKDFKLNESDPSGQGSFVNIRDGSVRWPVVRQALERIGYSGWMTIEGGDLSMEEHGRRLDAILAGK